MKTLSERLKAERKKRKINRFIAAQQIGISPAYIANIEQGQIPAQKTEQKIINWINNKLEK